MNSNKGKVKWAVVLLDPNMEHQYWKEHVPHASQKQDTWLKIHGDNTKVATFATRKEAETAAKAYKDGMYHWRVQKYVRRETIA